MFLFIMHLEEDSGMEIVLFVFQKCVPPIFASYVTRDIHFHPHSNVKVEPLAAHNDMCLCVFTTDISRAHRKK